MKKANDKTRYSPSEASPPQKAPDIWDLASGTELEKMIGEAKRQFELDRQAAAARGPVAKVLLALTLMAALAAATIGVYGIYNFPDAPIRQAGSGYVGKYGKAHTQAEFEAFSIWKQAMFIAFPAVFVFGFAFGLAENSRRRKSAL